MAPREAANNNADVSVDETAAQLGLLSVSPKEAIVAAQGSQAKVLLDKATTSASAEDRQTAAKDLVALIASQGPHSLDAFDVPAAIKAALENKKNAVAKEGALGLVAVIASSEISKAAEPFVAPLIPVALELLADKAKPVQLAAQAALPVILKSLHPASAKMVLPMLYNAMDYSKKWQIKEGALKALGTLVSVAPKQMTKAVPEIIPLVSDCMW